MTIRLFAEIEKLEEIERMIQSMKAAKSYGYQLDILSAIAKDIRARTPETITQALQTLEKKIDRVLEGKTEVGYNRRDLAHLATYVVGFWPTIRAALVDKAKAEKESA